MEWAWLALGVIAVLCAVVFITQRNQIEVEHRVEMEGISPEGNMRKLIYVFRGRATTPGDAYALGQRATVLHAAYMDGQNLADGIETEGEKQRADG